MWVVHFTDKNGKATVSVCQNRDAALKSARGLRQHFCVVHYISGPIGARIELKEILRLVLTTGTECSLEVSLYWPSRPRREFRRPMGCRSAGLSVTTFRRRLGLTNGTFLVAGGRLRVSSFSSISCWIVRSHCSARAARSRQSSTSLAICCVRSSAALSSMESSVCRTHGPIAVFFCQVGRRSILRNDGLSCVIQQQLCSERLLAVSPRALRRPSRLWA